MGEADVLELDQVDLEVTPDPEPEEVREEGPEILVLWEKPEPPSVQEFFVSLIENVLASRLIGLATHDHITDSGPEPWLENLLAPYVKADDVFITVQKVLDGNEELIAFVQERVRETLRANLDTIGQAVKGILEELGVLDKLATTEEQLSTFQTLVDNKTSSKREFEHSTPFEFLSYYVGEVDGVEGPKYSKANSMTSAAWAEQGYKIAMWAKNKIAEHTEEIDKLKSQMNNKKSTAANKKTTTSANKELIIS